MLSSTNIHVKASQNVAPKICRDLVVRGRLVAPPPIGDSRISTFFALQGLCARLLAPSECHKAYLSNFEAILMRENVEFCRRNFTTDLERDEQTCDSAARPWLKTADLKFCSCQMEASNLLNKERNILWGSSAICKTYDVKSACTHPPAD